MRSMDEEVQVFMVKDIRSSFLGGSSAQKGLTSILKGFEVENPDFSALLQPVTPNSTL